MYNDVHSVPTPPSPNTPPGNNSQYPSTPQGSSFNPRNRDDKGEGDAADSILTGAGKTTGMSRGIGTRQTTTSGQSHRSAKTIISKGAHRKPFPRIPFFHRPRDDDGRWLEEEHEATEWLSLFYDLVVVAVLTVFSSTHELSNPNAIPIFLSYFSIITWVWVAQTRYDVRYQADDVFHRICKSFQIAAFVYIGAASGNWNPSYTQEPSTMTGLTKEQEIQQIEGISSFLTVAIAFAATRVLLAVQYFICICLGRNVGRSVKPLYFSIAALAMSTVLIVVGIALPPRSSHICTVKIALVYLAIVLEMVVWRVQMTVHQHGSTKTSAIAERYGAFTLIILGEGFISVVRSLDYALSGLGVNTDKTYAQVVLAIFIIFMLWIFLFNRFDKEDEVSQLRALYWEVIHFGLHFSLLLLLAAIVNTIILVSYYQGITAVTHAFNNVIGSINNGTELSDSQLASIQGYLNRLALVPSFEDEYETLKSVRMNENRTEDYYILEYQYYGQICALTAESYGIELPDSAEEAYIDLYSINTTAAGDDLSERRTESTTLLITITTDTTDTALSGVLWLYPSAGGALILSAIRSMIWYRFIGPAHWIVHGIQIGAGFALALLGFLDIGGKNIIDIQASDVLAGLAPMYQLLDNSLPLVIVVIVYLGVYFGTILVLNLVQRYRGGVYADEAAEGEEEEHGLKHIAHKENKPKEDGHKEVV